MTGYPVSYEQILALAANELGPAEAAAVQNYVARHDAAGRTVRRYRAIRVLMSYRALESPRWVAVLQARSLYTPRGRSLPG